MAKTGIKNVILQGNTYYAELSIPADVRSVFEKRKFRKSLKTSDRQTAKALSQQFVGRWKLMILEARDKDVQDWKEAWKESKDLAETVQGKVEHEVSTNPFTKEIIYDENGEPTVTQSYTPLPKKNLMRCLRKL